MARFRLLLVLSVCEHGDSIYTTIGRNYETRKQAENAKRSYSFERSGVVRDARALAKAFGLRSPWKIEEEEA